MSNLYELAPKYYGITNTGALGSVVAIEYGIDDYVVLGNGHKSRIRYEDSEVASPYFVSYGQRWYLNELC